MNREMIQELGKGEDEVTLAMVWRVGLGDQKKRYVLREVVPTQSDINISREGFFGLTDPSENLFPWTDLFDADLKRQNLDKINWKNVYNNAAARLLRELNVLGSMYACRYVAEFDHGIRRHLVAFFFNTLPATPEEFSLHYNEFTPMLEAKLDSDPLPVQDKRLVRQNEMIFALAATVRVLSSQNIV